MKKIIPPVDRELLKAELNPDRHLRQTNRAGNELYVVGPDAVNVIKEIGRLREIAFRNDGGGTGEALDIDKFDTDPAYGYRQLVLWDPEAEEIIGGYRFCLCDEAVYDRNGQPILTSSHMFEFSKKFLRDYLPYTMYKDRLKYFFGKMTIYPDYQPEAREMVMYFLKKYFGEKADLIKIRKQIKIDNPRRFHKLFNGKDYKENYKILKTEVLKLGVSIPPLVNTYMNLSPSMIYFGTGINDEFADVLDSGILITFEEMYPDKIDRHANTFRKIGWRAIKAKLKRFQRKD